MADLMMTSSTGLDNLRPDIIEQNEAFGKVSNKYIATSSQDIIDEMNRFHAFKVTGFNNSGTRVEGKDGFQKHVIRLEDDNSTMLDGTKMQIVLYNSNDRTSSIRMMLGVFRLVCDNGMVLSDEFHGETKIKHTKVDWRTPVADMMRDYEATKQKTEDMIERMMKKQLTYAAIAELSEHVAAKIWKGTGTIIDPYAFSRSKRMEDNGKDLWHTYQRIQNNLLTGGVDRLITRPNEEGKIVELVSRTHKVTDGKEKIRMNQELHKACMALL